MNRKEFTKHYINIFNFPDIGKHPEKEDYLKDEIQKLADIDKTSYPLALDKIYDVFFSQYFDQYFDADHDDNNFREVQKATLNLIVLKFGRQGA